MRAARACPEHLVLLEETAAGALRCPHRHVARVWLVVDIETGEVLGAGRSESHALPAKVWLAPGFAGLASWLAGLIEPHYALPRPARPQAA